MSVELRQDCHAAIPLILWDRATCEAQLPTLPAPTRRWLEATGFAAKPDSHALVPAEDGGIGAVYVGVASADARYALAALPQTLPPGAYALSQDGLALDEEAAALSWELGSYQFDLFKPRSRAPARLWLPPSEAARRGLLQATAIAATRDLVNTPAEQMGPAELAAAIEALGEAHSAKVRQVVGDALLKEGFPAVHAVGRAASRAPRVIELTWGKKKHPLVTLVGKGVCFDSGGLDIKPADGMRQMKKDMGGAANAIGLAMLIMALKLPVRLRLLVGAVENAIAGNAYRPGDVFQTRSGLHIEIGNTDAEGRVVLCDLLACAAEERPELLIDMATLTGAARVALGAQLPALFCRDMAQARELVDLGLACDDPMWHLPLWQPYAEGIASPIADLVNTGRNAQAGAINAALFLDRFVPPEQPWLHIDLYAWNDLPRPGRPVGGEAQTLRTLLTYLERRYRD